MEVQEVLLVLEMEGAHVAQAWASLLALNQESAAIANCVVDEE